MTLIQGFSPRHTAHHCALAILRTSTYLSPPSSTLLLADLAAAVSQPKQPSSLSAQAVGTTQALALPGGMAEEEKLLLKLVLGHEHRLLPAPRKDGEHTHRWRLFLRASTAAPPLDSALVRQFNGCRI